MPGPIPPHALTYGLPTCLGATAGAAGARKIIVGRQGAVVGALGVEARKDLAEQWGRTVHLILNVRVAKDQ